jgi:hypothetical protein
MKGFKNSTRMRSGFHFGQNSGFSSSSGRVQNISYTRKTPQRKNFAEGGLAGALSKAREEARAAAKEAGQPKSLSSMIGEARKEARKPIPPPKMEPMKKARGGRVGNTLHGPIPDSQLNVEAGPKAGLRPGFSRGGDAPRYAKGGRIPPSKVAAREARAAVQRHVATPAPKGHKGAKGC